MSRAKRDTNWARHAHKTAVALSSPRARAACDVGPRFSIMFSDKCRLSVELDLVFLSKKNGSSFFSDNFFRIIFPRYYPASLRFLDFVFIFFALSWFWFALLLFFASYCCVCVLRCSVQVAYFCFCFCIQLVLVLVFILSP